jgi:DNA-binding transcriptional regulator YdaS (Cro superfamily)
MNTNEIINILGGTSKVARMCGVTAAAACQWRKKGIPEDRMIYLAASLEKATNGAITRKSLFPNDWQNIWIELVES